MPSQGQGKPGYKALCRGATAGGKLLVGSTGQATSSEERHAKSLTGKSASFPSSPEPEDSLFLQDADRPQPIQEGCTADLPLTASYEGRNPPQGAVLFLASATHTQTAFYFNGTWISMCGKPKPSQCTCLFPGPGSSKHLVEHHISPSPVGQGTYGRVLYRSWCMSSSGLGSLPSLSYVGRQQGTQSSPLPITAKGK